MDKSYLEEALNIISSRRSRVMTENERRFAEINSAIPAISAVNQQLYRTSRELIKIISEKNNVDYKLEILKRNNLQAQNMIKTLLKENNYPSDYLELKFICPKCEDTGYINGQQCDCLKKLYKTIAVKHLNSVAQVKLCRFSDFNLEYYRNQTSASGEDAYSTMNKIFNFCRQYANNFNENSESLLMFGKTGLGKTHLSLSIASSAIDKGYTVIYDSTINLLNKIENEHFGRDKVNDTLSVILDVQLLILDDLGTEYDTQFNVSTVYNIINTRLNKNLPTIVSTNLSKNEIQARYEERIVSRLYANYIPLKFIGNDVRFLKRKNKPAQERR